MVSSQSHRHPTTLPNHMPHQPRNTSSQQAELCSRASRSPVALGKILRDQNLVHNPPRRPVPGAVPLDIVARGRRVDLAEGKAVPVALRAGRIEVDAVRAPSFAAAGAAVGAAAARAPVDARLRTAKMTGQRVPAEKRERRLLTMGFLAQVLPIGFVPLSTHTPGILRRVPLFHISCWDVRTNSSGRRMKHSSVSDSFALQSLYW